jgi:hypothetical protein
MKFCKLALLLCLVAAGFPAVAQSSGMRLSIPFDFLVAGKLFPAGQYRVVPVWKTTQVSWRIINEKNEQTSVNVITDAIESPVKPHHRSMVFRQSGGVYQMVEFWPMEHYGRTMPWSSLKRTFVADSQQVEVAAQ